VPLNLPLLIQFTITQKPKKIINLQKENIEMENQCTKYQFEKANRVVFCRPITKGQSLK